MMKHRDIERNLYEYLAGELPADEAARIERHLAECPRCAAECAGMRRALAPFGSPAEHAPSAERSEAYWASFAEGVERKIQADARRSRHARTSFWEDARAFVLLHRAPAFAAAAACVALGAVLAVLLRGPAAVQPPPNGGAGPSTVHPEESVQAVPASERMERYLRKSKILLVGLTNMKTGAGRPLDLRAEREMSRSLIKEARYLQSQDIDRRSARLIEDLNKILIELANLEDEQDLPDVEIIRGGIHQENLLFKIRMAEVYNDSASHYHDNTF